MIKRLSESLFKLCLGISAVFIFVPAIHQAQVIENPANLMLKNAGRVLEAKEVLVISDEGTDKFYFKSPWGIKISPGGSVFIKDEKQLLQFDKDGRFLCNLFKEGQGPGEMEYVTTCLFTDNNVIVQAGSPDKLLWFDYAGNFIRQIPVRTAFRSRLTALIKEGRVFYLLSEEIPRPMGEPHILDVPNAILALNETSGEIRKLNSFPTKVLAAASPGGGGAMQLIDSIIAVPFKRNLLVLSHSREYLIKIYDPAADKVVKEFRRVYKRKNSEPLPDGQSRGGVMLGNKPFRPPDQKYQCDVYNIFCRGEEIWAVTSTRERNKGILIDIFDSEGTYRDCFYLKLPESALRSIVQPPFCALQGDYLWIRERTDAETYSLKKYQIVG